MERAEITLKKLLRRLRIAIQTNRQIWNGMSLKPAGNRTYGMETKGRRGYLKRKGHMKGCFKMKEE
jgi:hypothetical protein